MLEDLEGYFAHIGEKEKATSILTVLHGDILLDESISDPEAVLLATYMLGNKEKSNSISRDKVKEFFIFLGRDSVRFSKSVYELVNRRKPSRLKESVEFIGLTFSGKKDVEKILGGGRKHE